LPFSPSSSASAAAGSLTPNRVPPGRIRERGVQRTRTACRGGGRDRELGRHRPAPNGDPTCSLLPRAVRRDRLISPKPGEQEAGVRFRDTGQLRKGGTPGKTRTCGLRVRNRTGTHPRGARPSTVSRDRPPRVWIVVHGLHATHGVRGNASRPGVHSPRTSPGPTQSSSRCSKITHRVKAAWVRNREDHRPARAGPSGKPAFEFGTRPPRPRRGSNELLVPCSPTAGGLGWPSTGSRHSTKPALGGSSSPEGEAPESQLAGKPAAGGTVTAVTPCW
jgi:hypothetical protein